MPSATHSNYYCGHLLPANDTTGLAYAQECYEQGHAQQTPFLIYCGAVMTAYQHYLKGAFAEAERYIREATFVMQRNGFQDQANVYNLYGRIMHRLHHTAEAESYFRRAIDTKEPGNTSAVVDAYLGYAELLQEGLAVEAAHGNTVFHAKLLHALALAYEHGGNVALALAYYKEYQQESDSLFSAEKERTVGEMRARYDVERQEHIIEQKEMELYRKESALWLLAVVLVAVVAIASLLYYLYHKKNRLYLAIVKQNQENIRHEQQLQKYAASSLTDEKKQNLFERLERLMHEERIYTDNLLTKDKVAERLQTNRTYLSQLINEHASQTFTQYVNGYRTKEAVRRLSNPADNTPLKALSAELGFNSMTTFYSQFQAATGMTPTQCRNKVKELG